DLLTSLLVVLHIIINKHGDIDKPIFVKSSGVEMQYWFSTPLELTVRFINISVSSITYHN
ncbi:hypothetical protein, partial [Flavobacterium kayseriense]|uniref:hypothetical protein n=1 Tax=Flavobacterium kayseriense TaxID=2764714 RepID=UPI001C9B8036